MLGYRCFHLRFVFVYFAYFLVLKNARNWLGIGGILAEQSGIINHCYPAILFNWKFYTIIFVYIFLFGCLGASFSAIDEGKIDGNGIRESIVAKGLAEVSNSNRVDLQLVPRVEADTNVESTVEEFVLIIPSIGLEQGVIENVDPRYPEIYMPVLDENIAHGKYTRMPDGAVNEGNVYLFAHREWLHNGKDVGFFGRLDELGDGDVAIIRYNGKNYSYKFRAGKVVDVGDVSVYTDGAISPTLTLQTCEGSEKRLMVWFDLIEVV
ncbi:sortase [Candidatus Dojkabacteria bacterium]|nr:sortase [Candidatus Dojkabacteria bacterium]